MAAPAVPAAPSRRFAVSQFLNRVANRPQALNPTTNAYAWGTEAWLNSTRKEGQAALQATPTTLAEAIKARPQMLGRWARLIFGDDLPIFTKFLSTRFPPKVHIGFKQDVDQTQFRMQLVREQELLGQLHNALQITSETDFARFRAIYDAWAAQQANAPTGGWTDATADAQLVAALETFRQAGVSPERLGELIAALRINRALII